MVFSNTDIAGIGEYQITGTLQNSDDFTEDYVYAGKYNITFRVVKSHYVTFNSNGGNNIETQRIKEGEHVKEPSPPKKDGFNFAGWYTNNNYTNKWNFETNTVDSAVTLYAKWEEIQKEPASKSTGFISACFVCSGKFFRYSACVILKSRPIKTC